VLLWMQLGVPLFGVFGLCFADSARGAEQVDLAVLPVSGSDSAQNVTITELLRNSIMGFGLDVLSSDDTAAVIDDAAAFGAACDVKDPACALQLGGIAGVRRVVVGVVAWPQIQLRLYDVAGEKEVKNAFVAIGNDPSRAVRLAAVRLLRPDLEVGGLFVTVDVAGAAIVVDGEERGVSPTSTISLKPGRHEVYITHFDHESQTFSVDINFGATSQLTVKLDTAKRAPKTTTDDDDDNDDGDDVTDVAFTRVFVLDVVAPGYDPLAQGLATQAAVESLQCLEGLLVVTGTDLSALVDEPSAATLSACRADACWTQTLQTLFGDGEVLIIDSDRSLDGMPISGRRYDLQHGILLANLTAGGPQPEDLITGVQKMARSLYSDQDVRVGATCGEALADRMKPPPLTVTTFGVTAGATVVAAAAAATLYGLGANANANDDVDAFAAFTNAGTVMTVGAGLGLVISVLEAPGVDWGDVDGQNQALVEEFSSRRVTRRLGPERGKRRPRSQRR
jgi:hypothetical protein